MKVAFDPSALGDQKSFRWLTQIAWMFLDGVHHWVVPSLDDLFASRWWRELTGPVAGPKGNVWSELAEASFRAERTADMVVTAAARASAAPPWSASARDAEHHLRQPVLVVVENARCDGAFLRLLALRVGERKLQRHFGATAFEEIKRAWTSPLGDGRWISVRHGGGATTADQVRLAVEASTLPPRIVVIVDSDREHPQDAPKGTAADVELACLEVSKPGWTLKPIVLSKREVENYIPHRAIRAHHPGLDALLLGNDPDHVDLKQLHRHVWRVMTHPDSNAHLHERAWRDRAGRGGQELDAIIAALVEAQ